MAYKLNGKNLPVGKAFTLHEIQYPSNWLQLATKEEKEKLGITWEADPVRADDRYYWNGELDNPKELEDVKAVDKDGNPVWVRKWNEETESMVNTPVRLVTKGLKSTKITEVNHTAGTILANTDWYVTRKVERDVDIPENVVTHRAAIVTEVNKVETALAEVKNVESLIKVMEEINWDVL